MGESLLQLSGLVLATLVALVCVLVQLHKSLEHAKWLFQEVD